MNTNVMFSSEREDWTTPQNLFDELNAEFHFTLDAAASPDNAKCERFFTAEQNALRQNWGGETVFCNPPYCRKTGDFARYPKYKSAYIKAFDKMIKAREEAGLEQNEFWKSGEAVFKWWMEEDPRQMQLFGDDEF